MLPLYCTPRTALVMTLLRTTAPSISLIRMARVALPPPSTVKPSIVTPLALTSMSAAVEAGALIVDSLLVARVRASTPAFAPTKFTCLLTVTFPAYVPASTLTVPAAVTASMPRSEERRVRKEGKIRDGAQHGERKHT